MATRTNRHLQPSIRPLRSEYRVTRDHGTGRIIYTPFNEMGFMDYVEFVCNVATCGLLTWFAAVASPFVNHHWPLCGIIFLVLALWQNESWTRWPVRCVAWALFWGWVAL